MRFTSLLAAAALFAARVGAALPAGPEFQVNTTTAGDQGYPAACIGGGGATLAWESRGADGGGALLARRAGARGTPLGDELELDALSPGVVQAPAVACAPDGGYIVVWERRDGA